MVVRIDFVFKNADLEDLYETSLYIEKEFAKKKQSGYQQSYPDNGRIR